MPDHAQRAPSGTVTFLFTDIEGSTALWEQHRDAMRQALMRHDTLVEQLVAEHHGHVVRSRGEGDSRFAVFARATDAVSAAAALQKALHVEPWPTPTPLRVRIALHTGEADLRDGDYYGSAVNRCARLRAIAQGGQTLVSLTTEQLVRGQLTGDIGLRDLGEHRLKDLQHSERVFQLIIDGLPADFPPLQTLDARPNNIPLQATPFVGREREMVVLRQRLLDSQVRLLTMTGPGGTGKTRLALQVAAEVLDEFTDGVWLVELAPMHDPAHVMVAIAAVFGMTDTGDQPLAERLATFLRPKHLLLVLDNFEQVLSAASDVARLLAAAAALKVLVTSRAVLHLSAEHTFPVPPLGLPDVSQPSGLEALLQSDAVTFFLKRAQAVRPEFELTEATAPAVAEICARLDGLPLALELAAARTRLFAPQALLARLQPERARLQFLSGGARDLPARQQTIRNTIAWSYGLLSAAEQRLFRRLAVFVGGWTVEAAEAVCDIDGDLGLDGLEGLTALVEQSLVRQIEGSDGEPRFRRLETIREYAVEQFVASDEAEGLRARHAAYYLRMAETADPALRGHEQVAWMDRLEVEYLNIRAALEWCLRQGDTEIGLRLAGALADFWLLHGDFVEGDQWLGRLVADRTGASPEAQATALVAAGLLANLVGDSGRGRMLLEEALVASRAASDAWCSAQVLCNLAEFVDLIRYAGDALAAAQSAGDPWLIAQAHVCTAVVRADEGAWEEARAELEASVVTFRRLGDAHMVYWTLGFLMSGLFERGLYDEAEAYAQEAQTNVSRVRQGAGIAHCHLMLGRVAYARQEHARADELLAESLNGFRKSGHRMMIAHVLVWLGCVALARGDDQAAGLWLDEGLALYREIGYARGIAQAQTQAARLARRRGQSERAVKLLGDGLAGSDSLEFRGFTHRSFENLQGLAGVSADRGQGVRAARLFGASAAHRSRAGVVNPPPEHGEVERDLAAARAQVDAETWAAAWAEGQAMTLEQAIAYALDTEAPDSNSSVMAD